MWNELVIGVGIAATALSLIGAAGFVLAVTWGRATLVAAVAAGMATVGVAGWATFWAFLADPALGRAFAYAVLLAAATTVVAGVVRSPEVRTAFAAVLPAVLMAVGITTATVALIGLWGVDREPFAFARARFSHPLPIDNQIPHLLLQRLILGEDPRGILPGWQSSDRPPLQTGVMLIVHGLAGRAGVSLGVGGLAAGIASQLLWIPAIAALVRSIGGRRRGVLAGMLFTGITSTVLVNTLFTWPKLLSAGMVVAAIAVVIEQVRPGARVAPARLALAGVLVALGMLAHGAALFALAIVVLVLLHRRGALDVRALGGLVAGAALTYLPWMLYQRFYDPPGTRLLSMHLAGVSPEEVEGGVLHEIAHAYAQSGWSGTLGNKWANLLVPVGMAPWQGVTPDGVNLLDLRRAEFFTISGAVGVAWISVLVVVAAAVAARVRRTALDPYASRVLLLLAFGVVSLVVWALAMFGPGSTVLHQGSHVVVLILLAAPLAWMVDRMPRAGVAVLVLGLALGLATTVPFPAWDTVPGATLPVAQRGILLGAVGAVCTLAAFVLASDLRSATRIATRPEQVVPAGPRPGFAGERAGTPVHAAGEPSPVQGALSPSPTLRLR